MATITLRNAVWGNGVNVDVRVGTFADCNQNAGLGANKLALNDTWPIDAGASNDVCYRRDPNPDAPDGSWTAWTTIDNDGNDQVVDVD